MKHSDDIFCIFVCKRHDVLIYIFFVLNMGRCKRKVLLQDYFIWLYRFKDLRATLYPYYLVTNPLWVPAKTSPTESRSPRLSLLKFYFDSSLTHVNDLSTVLFLLMLEFCYHLNELMAYLIHPFVSLADRGPQDFWHLLPFPRAHYPPLQPVPKDLWRICWHQAFWMLDFNVYRFLVWRNHFF